MPDVLIVGGAGTGWATAFHLKSLDPSLEVTVIERDPSLAKSSTMLSDGNIRVQFNLEENIKMSQYGFECLDNFGDLVGVGDDRPNVEIHRHGNLFLVDEAGRAGALTGLESQHRLGCRTEWMEMDAIATRFPAIRSDILVGGSFGPDDGPADAAQVVSGYRKRALADGATLLKGDVEALISNGARISGVRLDGQDHHGDAVIVAAGAWSPQLLETVGISVPVEPVMRTVYVVAGNVEGQEGLPSMFLPSGAYLLPERGGTFLMAWSTASDPVGFDFTPAPRSRFYDVIWPEIAHHLPAFDQLEVVNSWAGLYAQNRLDANAILGEWPEIDGLLVATGFSGHGFQHCHAMGRHLAELITGNTPSIDLSRFGPQRIIDNEPYSEHAGRII